MSYWRELSIWSPMVVINPTRLDLRTNIIEPSLVELLTSIKGRPLVLMPAIESGFDDKHPELIHWEFNKDFPTTNPAGLDPSLGMMSRIGSLVKSFKDKMHLWAKIYDRSGNWRYAINISAGYRRVK